ncbi:MAG: hypothetical protein LBP87_10715, partial [Planctomycetaceae bacterium]|nr:hypothetical protein [Planctomycetaceae bacterium]
MLLNNYQLFYNQIYYEKSYYWVLSFITAVSAQTITVQQWNFDKDREHWNGANCLKDVRVKDGIYRAVASGNDPFFTADGLDFATTNSPALEFRYR